MPFLPKLTSSLSNSSLTTSLHHHNHSHGSVASSGSTTPSNNTAKPDHHHHLNASSPSVANNNNVAHTSGHPFELSIDLESPPIILYGPPQESSGSLISGQLNIDITKDSFVSASGSTGSGAKPSSKKLGSSTNTLHNLSSTLSNLNLSPSHSNTISPAHSTNNSSSNLLSLLNVKDHVLINSIQLSLVQKVHYAKPFLPPSNTLANCSSCKKKSTELARWDIMTQAHNLPIGKHSYPFSHLLPGTLPATTSLGSSGITYIRYEIVAIASYNNYQNHQTMVKVVLPLNISRSILRGPDRNSLRVFPPTDVTATAVLPNVIHPKSSFALELKLDGVSTKDRRWRMRRVSWRIEENVKVRANNCVNHKTKMKVLEDHIRKNQGLTKPNIKRNQQSGPTTAVTVSNPSTGFTNPISPSQSNAGAAQGAGSGLSAQPTNASQAIQPDPSDDDISSINTGANLHPSDHANEELRQQQQQQEQVAEEERRKKEEYALYCEETRTIASGDLKNGWKSDFTGKGKIELVADINCFNLSSAAGPHHTHVSSKEPIEQHVIHPSVSCDAEDPVLGVSVNHVLIVEVVIAEEILQNASNSSLTPSLSHPDSLKKDSTSQPDQRLAELSPVFANHIKPTQTEPTSSSSASNPSNDKTTAQDPTQIPVIGVPTGSARVLRMQFKLLVTERSGLGIAWDDEVPPMYDDVSALSPPTYDYAMTPEIPADGTNPPLYPLNPAHTHTHIGGPAGMATPGVIYGVGNTPGISPRPSGTFQSLNGALDMDDFTLN